MTAKHLKRTKRHKLAYICQLFRVRFSSHHDRNFRKCSGNFRRFTEDFRKLPKMSEDVAMTYEHVQSYLKLFRWLSNILKTFESLCYCYEEQRKFILDEEGKSGSKRLISETAVRARASLVSCKYKMTSRLNQTNAGCLLYIVNVIVFVVAKFKIVQYMMMSYQ